MVAAVDSVQSNVERPNRTMYGDPIEKKHNVEESIKKKSKNSF